MSRASVLCLLLIVDLYEAMEGADRFYSTSF